MTRTIALIGATSGLGRAAADQLAKDGPKLLLVGRDPKRVQRLAEHLPAAVVIGADVATAARVDAAAAQITGAVDCLEVLINNAGVMVPHAPDHQRRRRCLRPARRSHSAPVSPTLSATCANNAVPACDTKPAPSAVTSTVTGRPSRITFKVNLQARDSGLQQPEESLLSRTEPRSPGAVLTARPGLVAHPLGVKVTGLTSSCAMPRCMVVGRWSRLGRSR